MLVVVETRESGAPGWKSTTLPLRSSTSGTKMDRFLIVHGGVLQDVRLWSASLRRDGVQQLLPADDELSPPGSHKMYVSTKENLLSTIWPPLSCLDFNCFRLTSRRLFGDLCDLTSFPCFPTFSFPSIFFENELVLSLDS